jgi:hypothetical protein
MCIMPLPLPIAPSGLADPSVQPGLGKCSGDFSLLLSQESQKVISRAHAGVAVCLPPAALRTLCVEALLPCWDVGEPVVPEPNSALELELDTIHAEM